MLFTRESRRSSRNKQCEFVSSHPALRQAAARSVEKLEARQLLSVTSGLRPAASPVNTTLAGEGTIEVDLRASDLAAGAVNSWNNEGTAGGAFTPFKTAAPTVAAATDSNGLSYQAVNFNGSTALTSAFNAPADLTGNSPRSIEVWVLNPTIDTIEETMVSWARRGGPDGTNASFSYGSTYAVGEWGGEYDMTWAGSTAPGAPNTAPPANVWHDMTFTYDGNGTEDVYVDGQLQLTGASNGTQSIAALATAAGFPINIGAQNDGNGNPAILGSLDIASVRILGGALTAADVQQNFAAGVPGQSAPLAAPSAAPVLAAPVANDKIVQLSWSYVGDAGTGFSYDVFRSDSAHPTPAAVASNLTSLSYSDTSVTNGVQYTYYVVAKNSAGSGPHSNSVIATPVPKAPATPTNFTASRVGASSNVALNWTASVNAPAGTTYDVKRGTLLNGDGSLGGTIVDVTPGGLTTTTATDTNAATNTTYYYAVTASDSGGSSAPSPAVKVGPAPAGVKTTLAGEGTIEVDLRASDLAAGSVGTWNNEGTAGGAFIPFNTGAPTVGAFTDANGITYQAVNFAGNTALSSAFNAPADLTGNSPRSIEVWVLNPTINGVEETMVSWARRGGPDGTNEGFSYGNTYGVGEWGGEYDMTWAGSAVPGAPTTAPAANVWHDLTFTYDGNGTEDVYVDGQLQLTGASNGTQSIAALATAAGFPINIAAQNDGNGNPAIFGSLDIASVRILGGALTATDVQQNFKAGVPGQTAPLAAPTAAPVLAAPVANDKVVQLSWSYVGDAGTGFSYDVFRSDSAHPTPTAVASNLTSLSYSDTSVTNGVQYTYYVVAKNSAGSGPHSNSVNVTPVAVAPATPANFAAGRVGIGSNVALSWNPSPFATSYDVKRGTALNTNGTLGGTITDVTPGGTTSTTALDTNAAAGSDFYYAVTASNAGGASAPATPILVAKVPTTSGLVENVYHLGGGNSFAFNSVFGGDLKALGRVGTVAASTPPNYSFVNTNDAFNYQGDTPALTPAFLGDDAAGAALNDTNDQADTIYDAQGYITAPTAGTYTFQIGNGNGSQADDIVGVYVNGNGTPGSGTLVAADGFQGAVSPFETSATTPGQATFMLPSGKVPVEIIYGNGFGGAFLHGVTITDPSGTLVTYGVAPPLAPLDVINDTTGGNTITLAADADGTDLDVTFAGQTVKVPINDAKGLTINDTGAADTIQVTNNALPKLLNLNGNFTVQGLTAIPQGDTIDIGKSTVAIPYPAGQSPLAGIQAYLAAGVIGSSAVAANKGYGIADVDDGKAVTLSYRLIGDLNGGGKVNFTNLVILAANYGKTGQDWAHGDLNYDGKVNFADLVALAANYGKSSVPATGAAQSPLSAALTVATKNSAHHSSPTRRRR